MKNSNRSVLSRVWPWLRFPLVIGLLALLVRRLEMEELKDSLQDADLKFVPMMFGFFLLEVVLRAINWKWLLQCQGYRINLWSLFYAYMTGSFFGFFLPSSLGSDMARAVALHKQSGTPVKQTAISVVALNVMSLLLLVLLGSVGMWLLSDRLPEHTVSLRLLSAGLLALLPGFLIALRLRAPLKKWTATWKGPLRKVTDFGWRLVDAFRVFEDHPKQLAAIFLNSLLVQASVILTVYSVSLVLGGEIPVLYFFLFTPVITLSRLIPLSVANIGAEQGYFIFLFGLVGVMEERAFLISLMLSSAGMIFLASGGLLSFLPTPGKEESSATSPLDA